MVNRLANPEQSRQHREFLQSIRAHKRTARAARLRALQDFANLDDTPDALRRFRRKYAGFEPFHLQNAKGERQNVLDARFLAHILIYRDFLRVAWKGEDDTWQLNTLLGMNPTMLEIWEAPSDQVDANKVFYERWNLGVKAIRDARLSFEPYWPPARALWRLDDFSFAGSDFQQAVYDLWREKWRARVCPSCDSYFVAKKPGSKFCSPFCAQQAKNERNLKWWRERGPEWRNDYLREKAKSDASARRRSRKSPINGGK